MINKEWVGKAVEAFGWEKVWLLEGPRNGGPARRWIIRATDEEECTREIASSYNQSVAWAKAKEVLEAKMRKEIGRALRLKDFLARVAASG